LNSIARFGFHQRLLSRGYAVANDDYRLSGKAHFSAQLPAVQAAIAWTQHYAEPLRLDTRRFALLDEPSGAYLAALAELCGTELIQTHAMVDWYGVAVSAFLRRR
jgi:acetyl esterase/lipase